jgi:long-chain-fatty-acid--[acyl-carrier-protein] ligase
LPEPSLPSPATPVTVAALETANTLNRLLRHCLRALLWLRYRIRVQGLERIAPADGRGILFLPNHPALIDPVIMLSVLTARFWPRALANRRQVNRPVVRWLAKRIGVRTIGDVSVDGRGISAQTSAILKASIAGLRRGEALLLYPAGRIYRGRLENLGGNSAVELMLRAVPDVRVILARTRGLWGPRVGQVLKQGLWGILTSGLFFAPRRTVSIELSEPDDFPRNADRHTINRYLERYYNVEAPPNIYVPYSRWERRKTRSLPEPAPEQEVCQRAGVHASDSRAVGTGNGA